MSTTHFRRLISAFFRCNCIGYWSFVIHSRVQSPTLLKSFRHKLTGLRSLLDTKAIEAGCGWGDVVQNNETAAIAGLGSKRYPVGVIQRRLVFDEVSRTDYGLNGKIDIGSTNQFEIEDGRRGGDAVAVDRKRKAAVGAARGHRLKIDL